MNLPSEFAGARLVVWDLDDTLWRGTLDEGDQPEPTGLHHWVEPLARAGVMNSVCSNNDTGLAMVELSRLGLVEWIVFPRISWRPKHELLAGILTDVRLQPKHVVYVDDLARHRRLATDWLGLRSVDPAALPVFDGEPDRSVLSDRLQYYRALERRTAAAAIAIDPREFLADSGVTVAIAPTGGDHERVAALSQRANQLNFTGSRLGPADVLALDGRRGVEARTIWVHDRYGDYGLCGFYARRTGGPLLHLFFSCRLLYLGVEAHVHAQLGRPPLASSSRLVTDDRWRELAADVTWVRDATSPCPPGPARPATFWVGGCELQILSGLLAGSDDHDRWLLPDEYGGAQVYARSSLLALDAADAGLPVLESIPWTRGAVRPGPNSEWTTLVLSPWVDCACLTYVHRPTGTRFPSFVALDRSSSSWDWEHWWGRNPGRESFLADCEPAPPLDEDEIVERLVRVAARIGVDRQLLVLTVPEVDNGRDYPWGRSQLDRHRSVNVALEAAAHRSANLALVDLRGVVTSEADLHDPDDPVMFHYRRDRYWKLAGILADRLADPTSSRAGGTR